MAEVEAACDRPELALGDGDPEPSDRGRPDQVVPEGVRLSAGSHPAPGLHGVSPQPSADRQRGDGGGVQDGVQPTAETFGDGLERRGRAADRGPTGHPSERRVVAGASIVLAIEDASRGADSGGESEEEARKSRVIRGTGATAPFSTASSRAAARPIAGIRLATGSRTASGKSIVPHPERSDTASR